MRKEIKSASFIAMLGALFIAAGITLSCTSPMMSMSALECDHVGNHYTQLTPTLKTSGTHEYWVCCKCHKSFLDVNEIVGTWTNAGQASAVSEGDARYLAPYTDLGTILSDMGFKDVTFDSASGTYTIGSYNGNESQVIIPEGVGQIKAGTFKGNTANSWFVIPTSVEDSQISGMMKTGASKCTLFFMGSTTWTASTLKAKAVYEIIHQGWDYVNGVPTPLSRGK